MNTTETVTNRIVISAAWYLRRHEFKILEQNWECKKGKIDIVAIDRNCLVIVSVKEATSKDSAFAKENTPTAAQRVKWEDLAFEYLASNAVSDMPLRFDTMEIKRIDEDRCMIKHHVNALGCA